MVVGVLGHLRFWPTQKCLVRIFIYNFDIKGLNINHIVSTFMVLSKSAVYSQIPSPVLTPVW